MSHAVQFIKGHKYYSGAVLFVGVIVLTTQPNRLPAWLIVLVFGAIISLLYKLIRWVIGWTPLPALKATFASGATTAALGLLLILQTTGQLTIRDFLSFIAIFAVGWVYVSRFSLSRSP